MEKLPKVVNTDRLIVRQYQFEDAQQLMSVIRVNLEHLRPWMPWIKDEPQSLEQKESWILNSQKDFELGSNFAYGIFLAHQLIGGVGLHRRIGKTGIEIGYWLAEKSVGFGYMSETVEVLAAVALELDDVDHVEIHHDVTNDRSRTIPEKLGFELLEERPREIQAANETGIECIWRITEGFGNS